MALRVIHRDDLPEAREVRPQTQNGRKAAVHIRQIDRSDVGNILYTFYDPGLVLERHGHVGDQVIYVIDGDVMIGDQPARKGSTIVLEKNTPFGPLVAGEKGALILEVFIGPGANGLMGREPESFRKVLDERGITLLPEADPETPPAAT
jgi:hypothetical protein